MISLDNPVRDPSVEELDAQFCRLRLVHDFTVTHDTVSHPGLIDAEVLHPDVAVVLELVGGVDALESALEPVGDARDLEPRTHVFFNIEILLGGDCGGTSAPAHGLRRRG